MKPFFIVLIAFLLQDFSFGQRPRRITQQDSVMIQKQIELKSSELKKTLLSQKANRGYPDELDIEFRLDTFKIKQKIKMQLDIDYSTSGMVRSTEESTRSYDRLLNKYYQKLIQRLESEDKEVLRRSQRNWIKFRDSEIKLNDLVSSWGYSEGGSDAYLFAKIREQSITENRLIEIYRYLTRIVN